MAGLQADSPTPTALTVHGTSRLLEVAFSDGAAFSIPFELMRVYSPSAEVQGHGPGQEVLQTGKREVGVLALEPIGNYAVKPTFSDGHESGLFTWEYLHFLGSEQDALWTQYNERLNAAGVDRDAPGLGKGRAAVLEVDALGAFPVVIRAIVVFFVVIVETCSLVSSPPSLIMTSTRADR